MVVAGTIYLVFEQANNNTSQTLEYRAEKEIYRDLLSSVDRTHSAMNNWGSLTIHSEDDLANTVTLFEEERNVQNTLYDEYASLPNTYKTDEKIRGKFADIAEHGPFPDRPFIDSLGHQREAERDFRITLEHHGCDKTCAVYSVSIKGDGSVLYKGLKNVKHVGKLEYEIPREDITKLNEFLYDVYHGKINDHYGSKDNAQNTVVTTIEFGQVKRIAHYDKSGPESLKKFEDKIKEVAMINQFIHPPAKLPPPDALQKMIVGKVDSGEYESIFVGIITKNGTEQYHYGNTGEGEKPIDENTIFEVGSISKVFTSLILADMVANNEISLDDTIEKFLPENVETPTWNGDKITLLDLATHTSGLPRMPNYPPNPDLDKEYEYDKEGLYEYLSDFQLSREIGSQYEYSNTGGSLLGHVLSLHAEKSYEQTLKERILDKLGLDSTCVNQCDELRDRFATPHSLGEEADEVIFDDAMAGAGGVRSSGNDMLAFLSYAMDFDDSELQPAFELAQTPNHQINEILYIGLGWVIIDNGERNIVWHNGATHGFASFVGYDSDSKKGVVVLTNSQVLVDEIGLDILDFSVEE